MTLKKLRIHKAKSVTVILFIITSLCLPKHGAKPIGAEGFVFSDNILALFIHANWLHLLCNMWAIYCTPSPYYLPSSITIAILATLLPQPFTTQPIMGISGVLFAIVGAKYGAVRELRQLIRKILPFLVFTAALPNIAALYHCYCLFAAYLFAAYLKPIFRKQYDLQHRQY